LRVQTICVHGDTPGAATLVARMAAALREAGVSVAPVGAWL
jgi:lactam utilization protein B